MQIKPIMLYFCKMISTSRLNVQMQTWSKTERTWLLKSNTISWI